MCTKKTRQPDTSRQEAEAARQRQIEEERFAERLRVEQERFDRERQELMGVIDQERNDRNSLAEQQRADQQALLDRQLTFQNELAEQARQDRLMELEGQERDRARNQLLEDRRAAVGRAEATERGRMLDEARTGVESQYAKFNDRYFGDFANKFVGSRKPAIQREYDGKRRNETYNLGRRGILNGSGTARVMGRIAGEQAGAEQALAQEALSQANSLRERIDQSRSAALSTAIQGAQIAPIVLPEGIDERLVPDNEGLLDAVRGFSLNTAAPGPQKQQMGFASSGGHMAGPDPRLAQGGTQAPQMGFRSSGGHMAAPSPAPQRERQSVFANGPKKPAAGNMLMRSPGFKSGTKPGNFIEQENQMNQKTMGQGGALASKIANMAAPNMRFEAKPGSFNFSGPDVKPLKMGQVEAFGSNIANMAAPNMRFEAKPGSFNFSGPDVKPLRRTMVR
jgi:hypothetical protein